VTQRGAEEPELYRITGARAGHSRDMDQRINRYLVSMAIRTACVILVFVVPGPARWLFAIGAVFLPYVAVLFANATDRRRGQTQPSPVDRRGLSGGDGSSVGRDPAAGREPAVGGRPGSGTRSRGRRPPDAPPAVEALEGILISRPGGGSGPSDASTGSDSSSDR
jgi:hypothetical protein